MHVGPLPGEDPYRGIPVPDYDSVASLPIMDSDLQRMCQASGQESQQPGSDPRPQPPSGSAEA